MHANLLILQTIKVAIDVNALGDTLTPEQLSIADDLYYQRIPELWRRACGAASPPPLQSLSTFVNDIVARSTHFERILVLVSKQRVCNFLLVRAQYVDYYFKHFFYKKERVLYHKEQTIDYFK